MPSRYHETYFTNQPIIVDRSKLGIVNSFSIAASFAPFPFDDNQRHGTITVLYDSLFSLFAKVGLRKNSISFTSNIKQDEYSIISRPNLEERQQKAWFIINYTEPGRSFRISLSDTRFTISAESLALNDLVNLCDTVFHDTLAILITSPVAEQLSTHERATSIDYIFYSKYRIGDDLIQQKASKNHQVVAKALALDRQPAPGVRTEVNALPSLGIEEVIRVDFNQHALKQIGESLYNTKIRLEAPFNEGNSIIYVTATLAMEEEFGFSLVKGIDTKIALVDFYRDIVLKRFIDNLLCSVNYSSI